jgi:hypothetical protein
MSSVTSPKFKKISIAATLVLAAGTALYFLVSEYIQAANMQQVRQRMIHHFTATTNWIAFTVALSEETAALAIINRISGHRKLVLSPGYFLAFPSFSADGERVLVVRANQAAGSSELLSCSVENWSCRVLVRAPHQIAWPLEVRKDVVLYAGSEPFGIQGRRRSYDLYLAEGVNMPIRLSTLMFYNLNALNVIDDNVELSTAGSLGPGKVFFPREDVAAPATSEIFSLQIDWSHRQIIVPTRPLEPLYKIGGFSVFSTMSPDGDRVALLNRRFTAGLFRYNLVVATAEGAVQRYVEATSASFSRPAFVGTAVLANQIFDDRYETTLVDTNGPVRRKETVIYHSPKALQKLERLEISVVD